MCEDNNNATIDARIRKIRSKDHSNCHGCHKKKMAVLVIESNDEKPMSWVESFPEPKLLSIFTATVAEETMVER